MDEYLLAIQGYTFDLSCPTDRLIAADKMVDLYDDNLTESLLRSSLPIKARDGSVVPALTSRNYRDEFWELGIRHSFVRVVLFFSWAGCQVGVLNHWNNRLSYERYFPLPHPIWSANLARLVQKEIHCLAKNDGLSCQSVLLENGTESVKSGK